MTQYIKEEKDGSITKGHADTSSGVLKLHNTKGPALVNKEQKIKDYYLYGIKLTKEVWEKKRKFS